MEIIRKMSLLTNSEKVEFGKVLDDLAEVFSENVTYYQERDILTLSTTDTNYNYIYQTDQNNVTQTTQIHSGIFSARINYFNPSDNRQGYQNFPMNNLNIDNTKTYVRIRTKLANLGLLQGIKLLTLDGLKYEIQSAPKPHSLFPTTTKYVDVIFSSVK